jgi:hypothetical protein
MSDRAFELLFVPRRVADRVQREAVMSRLYRRLDATDVDAIWHYTLRLQRLWRSRLEMLARCNWTPRRRLDDPTSDAARLVIQYARNCQPTFCACSQVSQACRLEYLCPFCYGRWVREIWLAAANAFPLAGPYRPPRRLRSLQIGPAAPDPPPRFPYILVERRRPLRIPFLPDDVHRERAAQAISPGHYARRVRRYEADKADGKKPRRRSPNLANLDLAAAEAHLRKVLQASTKSRGLWFKKLGPAGGFAHTVIQPWPACWHVEQRQLLMFPADVELDEVLLRADYGVCRIHREPTRRVLYKAVVRTCSYPKWLLRGDAELTATLLRARRGIRLVALYGAFRKPKEQS